MLVVVKGKQDKKVPLILTKDMVEWIETIIQQRNHLNIPKNRTYVFACPTRNAEMHLDPCEAYRTVTEECTMLDHPELIR